MTTQTTHMDRLVEIMAQLRDPDTGCPWDVEQTFATIAPHTIEEAYEVAEAIEQNDMPALVDELGDLLLQVVFHAQMAQEAGHFDVNGVIDAICDKLVRRHPHIFSVGKDVATAADQTAAWETQKAEERRQKALDAGKSGAPSALDGVTTGLPALTRALKLQKRAARVGFDWPDPAGALDKIREETEEIAEELSAQADKVDAERDAERLFDEIGDVLFSCVNLARKLDIDPETALRHGNAKFDRRFRGVEAILAESGATPETSTLEEMDAAWDRVKLAD